MKLPQFYISVALSALCLILSIAFLLLSKSTQNLQAQFQAQQQEVNQATTVGQVFQNFAREMAQASVKNEKIRQILTQNGITFTPPSAPTNTPSPAK